MLVRQGYELAERILFGYVVEYKVFADITSNYSPTLVSLGYRVMIGQVAHNRTDTFWKHGVRLVLKGPSRMQATTLQYFHAYIVSLKGW